MTSAQSVQRPLAQESLSYLLEPGTRQCPYEFLRRLREQEPIHQNADGVFLISSYETGRAVLRDPRFSRAASTTSLAQVLYEPGLAADMFRTKLVNTDGDQHARVRKLVNRSFTPGAVERWRPDIQSVTEALVDGFEDQRATDLVTSFAYPLPERMICTLIGVPFEDHDLFSKWTKALTNRVLTSKGNEDMRKAGTAAYVEWAQYLRDLVESRRSEQRNDLLTQLIAAEEEGTRLSDLGLITLLTELIGGGHDTTANVIINGVMTLTTRPDTWRQLAGNPALSEAAVEEVLRYRSPIQLSLGRQATEDVEIDGVTIPAGAPVFVVLAAANRDPGTFDDPEEAAFDREDNRHIAFGFGEHFCLGAALARAEAQVAFETLSRRLPHLRVTVPEGELPWRQSTLITAPAALPVAW